MDEAENYTFNLFQGIQWIKTGSEFFYAILNERNDLYKSPFFYFHVFNSKMYMDQIIYLERRYIKISLCLIYYTIPY